MKFIAKVALCATLSSAALFSAATAFAAPAKQFKAQDAGAKEATFKDTHKVGQITFTDGKPAKGDEGHAGAFTYAKGKPADGWVGRGFFPGNLKEIADSLPTKRKNLQLVAYLTGAGKSQVLFQKKLDTKWEKWQFYTFSGKGKTVQTALAKLPAGDYNAKIEFKLVSFDDSKKKGSPVDKIALASGPVKISVTE